jgi:hypothetical protein
VLPALAQLDCVVEAVPFDASPPEVSGQRPTSIDHYIEFQDALTGEPLTPADVSALSVSGVSGAALTEARAETSPDGLVLRRVWALPPAGDSYVVRVDGGASRRYFGCERPLPVMGATARRVRVSLVPRARDVVVTVAVRRGGSERSLSAAGLRAVELRAAAEVERDIEIRRGRCSGEQPAEGSHWCVQALTLEPGPVALSASAPGYGLASVTLDARSAARDVPLTARYDGHFMPSATLRVGAAWAPLGGSGVGVLASLDVLAGSALHGQTCPLAETCVRPVMRLGAGNVPYRRTTTLVGPGDLAQRDGEVTGDLGVVELGGGVTVVPAGTGDALRFTVAASAVLGFRGDELLAGTSTVLSPSTTRFGAAAELYAGWRFFGPLLLHAGARLQGFPGFGGTGRRFSFLGDAPLSGESASLLQVVVFAGIGVEP